VAEKPVGRLPKDLGQPPRPPASLAAAHSVIRNASGREVLDQNKDTVVAGAEHWPALADEGVD
jgi:hypothetical protein